jgi:hypothetical protein
MFSKTDLLGPKLPFPQDVEVRDNTANAHVRNRESLISTFPLKIVPSRFERL